MNLNIALVVSVFFEIIFLRNFWDNFLLRRLRWFFYALLFLIGLKLPDSGAVGPLGSCNLSPIKNRQRWAYRSLLSVGAGPWKAFEAARLTLWYIAGMSSCRRAATRKPGNREGRWRCATERCSPSVVSNYSSERQTLASWAYSYLHLGLVSWETVHSISTYVCYLVCLLTDREQERCLKAEAAENSRQ